MSVDDCKTVNNIHYCYCNRQLCNGENAESIIEKLGDINEEDGEEDSENIDHEDASGSNEDDEDYNYRSTSRKVDSSSEPSTHDGTTAFVALSMPTTAQSTINKAVNSNLSIALIFLTFARLIIVYQQN